ncbi:hypothetical protein ES319_A11G256100v1 [Gossypium barbadense]|uniref:Uncharacterized protein n=2 Tax=Gossypium TaxID=3633 RepID=A0A5J5TXS5_GOSBA|nr:hypothetical protein ES319_A11G256100v1 [Gossypium barbadense]TYG95588.1 hypothetical protein ES288_A11G279900v1 [Gossypium darwinii]
MAICHFRKQQLKSLMLGLQFGDIAEPPLNLVADHAQKRRNQRPEVLMSYKAVKKPLLRLQCKGFQKFQICSANRAYFIWVKCKFGIYVLWTLFYFYLVYL